MVEIAMLWNSPCNSSTNPLLTYLYISLTMIAINSSKLVGLQLQFCFVDHLIFKIRLATPQKIILSALLYLSGLSLWHPFWHSMYPNLFFLDIIFKDHRDFFTICLFYLLCLCLCFVSTYYPYAPCIFLFLKNCMYAPFSFCYYFYLGAQIVMFCVNDDFLLLSNFLCSF